MCNAFSGIIKENGDVVWYWGIDSHEDILDKYNDSSMVRLTDRGFAQRSWARFEVLPNPNMDMYARRVCDYFNVTKWVLGLDEQITPDWFTEIHEKEIMKACKIWYDKLKPYLNVQNYNYNKPHSLNWSYQDQKAALGVTEMLDVLNAKSGLTIDSLFSGYDSKLRGLIGNSVVTHTYHRFHNPIVREETLCALVLDCFNLPEDFWTVYYLGKAVFTENPLKDYLYLVKQGYVVTIHDCLETVKVHSAFNGPLLFDSKNYDCKPEPELT